MAVSADNILEIAKRCLEMQCEAGYRSCISRAYYAMYHQTLASLQCVPNYSANHHSNLIGYLTNPVETKSEPYDSKKLKVLGYNLKQQRDARNEADYHLSEISISEEVAQSSYEASQLYFSIWADMKSTLAS